MELNPDNSCQVVSTAASPEGELLVNQALLSLQGQVQHSLLQKDEGGEDATNVLQKKRPLSDETVADGPTSSSRSHKLRRLNSSASSSTSTSDSSSSKKRRIRFLPDPANEDAVATYTKTYEIDYDKEDIWWTREESRAHCERQSSMLDFYQNNLPDMVDSCLLVWINCAEQALDDGNFCMTLEQRANVAEKISHSPVRGFEKELAAELISEQRQKTIGGLLELQELCRINTQLSLDEKLEAIHAHAVKTNGRWIVIGDRLNEGRNTARASVACVPLF